jgi:hypothetical protein
MHALFNTAVFKSVRPLEIGFGEGQGLFGLLGRRTVTVVFGMYGADACFTHARPTRSTRRALVFQNIRNEERMNVLS